MTMGLDMYLRKETEIWLPNFLLLSKQNDKDKKNVKKLDTIQEIFPELDKIKDSNVSTTITQSEDIGYWRKANAIHNWFVKYVQDENDDCGDYYVSLEKFKELLADINEVLSASEEDREFKAKKYMPPVCGFFFGSQDIDEYYIQSLEYTKDVVEKVIKDMEKIKNSNQDKNEDYFVKIAYVYTSSW